MFWCTSLEVTLPSLAQWSLVRVVALETGHWREQWWGRSRLHGKVDWIVEAGRSVRLDLAVMLGKFGIFCLKNFRSHQISVDINWEYFQQKTFYSERTERSKILIWNMLIFFFFNLAFSTNVLFFPWNFFFLGVWINPANTLYFVLCGSMYIWVEVSRAKFEFIQDGVSIEWNGVVVRWNGSNSIL